MSSFQPGILAPLPKLSRYLTFILKSGAKPARALNEFAAMVDGTTLVVGIGSPLARMLGGNIPGLRVFPNQFGSGLEVPSTPAALWCWLRGADRGKLLHAGRGCVDALAPAFTLESVVEGFQHDGGRDLTGYIDGTENPRGRRAELAAVLQGAGQGMDGSSFVAVQKWDHDFKRFEAMPPKARDDAIGRRRTDNVELARAPASAHVKRTAQESFDPEAFVLRRSMPWTDGNSGGLNFVAFGRSFDAFEAQLRRMVGADDGIVDGLFQFTRPVSGSYFWCPPMNKGRLDLRALPRIS